MLAVTWTRNEREKYWGPFTWSPREKSSDRLFGLHVTSTHEEGEGAYARLSLLGATLLCRLPDWLVPAYRHRNYLTTLSEDQLREYMERSGGRDWYWQLYEREYGFEFHRHELHWQWGVQNHTFGGPEDARRNSGCWFYPWTRRRTVRHDYLDLQGRFFAKVPSLKDWDHHQAVEASVPTKTFAFKDYDGEIITATLRLEERETATGEGRWEWLSWFTKNQVYRSFDIKFSSEVGPEKGSWKGGTVGHSIRAASPVENHADAFRRYCEERSRAKRSRHDAPMTFLHEVK